MQAETTTARNSMGLAATYWPVTVLAGFGICAASIGGVGIWVLNAMASSVGVDKPTPTQLEEEEQKRHALFRHVPALIDRLAWRELGTYPTPIHRATCMAKPIAATSPTTAAEKVSFYVKREDLSSSDAYAGNKIRTLQHQLAVIESKLERGCRQRGILVVGSGGNIHIHTYKHTYIHTYICVHICMHVCMHVCMYLCLYISI